MQDAHGHGDKVNGRATRPENESALEEKEADRGEEDPRDADCSLCFCFFCPCGVCLKVWMDSWRFRLPARAMLIWNVREICIACCAVWFADGDTNPKRGGASLLVKLACRVTPSTNVEVVLWL